MHGESPEEIEKERNKVIKNAELSIASTYLNFISLVKHIEQHDTMDEEKNNFMENAMVQVLLRIYFPIV